MTNTETYTTAIAEVTAAAEATLATIIAKHRELVAQGADDTTNDFPYDVIGALGDWFESNAGCRYPDWDSCPGNECGVPLYDAATKVWTISLAAWFDEDVESWERVTVATRIESA